MFLVINLGLLTNKSYEVLKDLCKEKKETLSSFCCMATIPIQSDKSILKYATIINGCIMTIFNEIGGYPTADLIFQCIKLRKPIWDYIKIKK